MTKNPQNPSSDLATYRNVHATSGVLVLGCVPSDTPSGRSSRSALRTLPAAPLESVAPIWGTGGRGRLARVGPLAPVVAPRGASQHPVSRARTRLATSDLRTYHAAADAASVAQASGKDLHGRKLSRTERRAARSRARAARHRKGARS